MTRMRTIGQRLTAVSSARLRLPPKVADSHYLTAEHRAWAKAVTARAGGACQACGATGKRLYADHIQELRDGGAATDLANGQALCGACHTAITAKRRAERMKR